MDPAGVGEKGGNWLYKVTGSVLFTVSPVWFNYGLYIVGLAMAATMLYLGVQVYRGKTVHEAFPVAVAGLGFVLALATMFLLWKLYQSQQAQYGDG